MGHYQEQDKVIDWSPDLTAEEREARRPFLMPFGVGRSKPNIGAAVNRARRALLEAEFVAELVEEQAVFAMTREGSTVREISEVTGISKSRVGRMVKAQQRHQAAAFLPPMNTEPHSLIRAAWER